MKPSPITSALWRVGRDVGAAILSVTAVILLFVGLVAPLTPSEGMPRPWDLAVFAAGPLVVLGGAYRCARTRAVRAFILFEGISLALFLLMLLVRLVMTSQW